MKLKNKGKVYPSPSSSSSSSSSSSGDKDRDVFSVLKLLPAAILALASVLSLEDREVLAYMITRSIKTTTNPNPSSISQDSKKKSSKKQPNTATATNHNHKSPIFDCDCFDCYTSYWFRWDSSPNRELIHQVIEAFEDHLTNGEQSRKTTRTKRKDKSGRRVCDKPEMGVLIRNQITVIPTQMDESESCVFSTDDGLSPVVIPEKAADGEDLEEQKVRKDNEEITELVVPAAETEEISVISRSPAGVNNHKGLARKVLPDVLGLLNSRLWTLWGPNV